MALFRPACTNKEGKGAGSKSQRQLEHCCTFTSTTCVFPAFLGRLSWFPSFWPGDASSAQSGNISRGEPRCGTTSASSRQPVAFCAPALAFCVEQFSALEPCRNKKAFFFVLNNIVSTRDPMQANKFTTLSDFYRRKFHTKAGKWISDMFSRRQWLQAGPRLSGQVNSDE